MIELIDQSEPDKLKFRCDLCGRVFVQPNHSRLDLHNARAGDEAAKLGIPPCIPPAVKAEPAAPKAEPKPRKRAKAAT